MIPQANITAWRAEAPWSDDAQVEQDLVLSRAVVEMFNDSDLAKNFALRGGTALNKVFIHPASRYSEDIDLVQIKAEPIGNIIDRLREKMSFLGTPRINQKSFNNTIVFKYESIFTDGNSALLSQSL